MDRPTTQGGQARLSDREIEQVLSAPNGPYALMELVRAGRVDSATAARALGRFDNGGIGKRFFLTLVDTLFPRG